MYKIALFSTALFLVAITAKAQISGPNANSQQSFASNYLNDNLTLPKGENTYKKPIVPKNIGAKTVRVKKRYAFDKQGVLAPPITQLHITLLQYNNDLYHPIEEADQVARYIDFLINRNIANSFEPKTYNSKTGELIAMNDCVGCDTNKKLIGHPATQVEESARGVASVVEVTNPNENLNLHPGLIKYICERSKLLKTPTYYKVKNMTSFEEGLYIANRKKMFISSLNDEEAMLPESSKAEIGQFWNDKLNQIYCPRGGDFSLDGYIEFQLLMSGQMEALYKMYAGANNAYDLDINRLIKKNPYDSDEDAQWITLADLIKDYIEHPVGQMNHAQGLRDRFKKFYKYITVDWGGKHASQLSPEEFKQALANRFSAANK